MCLNVNSEIRRKREMCIEFYLESLKGRDISEDLRIDGRVIIKWILGNWGSKVWIGFVWLVLGTSGGLFQTW
jgi:hypothetical protein